MPSCARNVISSSAKARNAVRFTDVAALIDPTTVVFESITDGKGTTVLEQNTSSISSAPTNCCRSTSTAQSPSSRCAARPPKPSTARCYQHREGSF